MKPNKLTKVILYYHNRISKFTEMLLRSLQNLCEEKVPKVKSEVGTDGNL